jgi:methylaspartate ammonia-lyase
MTNSPTLSSLLTIPTLTRNGRSQLSVGLQLSDGQQFWADCVVAVAASRQEPAAAFDVAQAVEAVQQQVRPLWQDQPITQFRPLAQQLAQLVVPFSYRQIAQPAPKPQLAPGTLSRRSLISGFMAEDVPPPKPSEELLTVERPLHPALQYGLTAVLLQAVAQVNKLSIAALVAKEYALDLPETAVPLQIPLNDDAIQTAQTILTTHVAALGYTTGKNKHKATLGAKGERLQQHIRQIAAWLPTLEATFQPTLHLNLRGGLGDLFENDSGKVLGALYGLEHAAKPFQLQVQNPILLDSREAQLALLQKLNNYLTMRQMTLKLVADAWVDSVADAKLFANPKICQMIHIELPRLGNLEAGITAVLHSLSQNQQVILSGEATALTSQIGLVTRPTQLSGPPQLHYNVMQQLLVIFSHGGKRE